MKTSKLLTIAISLILVLVAAAGAETRVYRQIKDVSVIENGNVSQSDKKENLFEYTFEIDRSQKTITRTKVLRLDKAASTEDKTEYVITGKTELIGSPSGNGGKVLVATSKDGTETLELGHRFAYSMRTSPFSQVIVGVYKRVYDQDHKRPGNSR